LDHAEEVAFVKLSAQMKNFNSILEINNFAVVDLSVGDFNSRKNYFECKKRLKRGVDGFKFGTR